MQWTVARWREIPGLEQRFGGRAEKNGAGVVTLRQVHGTTVLDARDVDPRRAVEGDGLVTDSRTVGVWTADCVPVHLVAGAARVAAAVHSGWRGTAAGIVDRALDLLGDRWNLRPGEVEAALGPAIGGCCYAVAENVRDAFRRRYGARAAIGFSERDGAIHLDLRKFLEARLREVGVAAVEIIGPCTVCRVDVLYSHRREGAAGRQLSAIGFR